MRASAQSRQSGRKGRAQHKPISTHCVLHRGQRGRRGQASKSLSRNTLLVPGTGHSVPGSFQLRGQDHPFSADSGPFAPDSAPPRSQAKRHTFTRLIANRSTCKTTACRFLSLAAQQLGPLALEPAAGCWPTRSTALQVRQRPPRGQRARVAPPGRRRVATTEAQQLGRQAPADRTGQQPARPGPLQRDGLQPGQQSPHMPENVRLRAPLRPCPKYSLQHFRADFMIRAPFTDTTSQKAAHHVPPLRLLPRFD